MVAPVYALFYGLIYELYEVRNGEGESGCRYYLTLIEKHQVGRTRYERYISFHNSCPAD